MASARDVLSRAEPRRFHSALRRSGARFRWLDAYAKCRCLIAEGSICHLNEPTTGRLRCASNAHEVRDASDDAPLPLKWPAADHIRRGRLCADEVMLTHTDG